MRYELFLGEEARNQIRGLPKAIRENIGHRLENLQQDLSGDVKKLTAREHKYRLRVRAYRVLFQLGGGTIFVYAVKHRKDAYE